MELMCDYDEDLLNDNFPNHAIRKQAIFKLVTEQIDRAKKDHNFRDIPINDIRQHERKEKVHKVTLKKDVGQGDTEEEKEATEPRLNPPPAHHEGESNSHVDEVVKEVGKEEIPNQKTNDKTELLKKLDSSLLDLGLNPISPYIEELKVDVKEEEKLEKEKLRNLTKNRRMPWTITQNDRDKPNTDHPDPVEVNKTEGAPPAPPPPKTKKHDSNIAFAFAIILTCFLFALVTGRYFSKILFMNATETPEMISNSTIDVEKIETVEEVIRPSGFYERLFNNSFIPPLLMK